ncbi:MAG: cytochrome C [Hydrogenophilales bacterium CG_4_9_14_3_um_filter_63_34]|nr:MAG: cytochrome C [Hydrogenophilales bacterium CG_4_10_14_3_um_filter_63_21]PJB02737.1 MAG: cytochrome C [Hydrogenophilales bacterium CG_4_9_14_3_um_filter_63_34]
MKTLFSLILSLALGSTAALAESDNKYGGENRGKPVLPSQSNHLWKQECGSCHMAFAPGLLPAASWRKVMSGLDKHFGADASLTPEENREITAFLVSNASNRWRAPTAPLRITETAWFQHKHRELAPAIWKRATVKGPANCAACHPGADQGDFNEHRVRIPR